jgi:type IV secretory pathway VirB10-like protein
VAPSELLRFGVGAWPAIAAAIVAHLLFMLASEGNAEVDAPASVQPQGVQPVAVQSPGVQASAVQPVPVDAAVQLSGPVPEPEASDSVQPEAVAEPAQQPSPEPPGDRRAAALPSPARDRARAAARRHAAHHGDLPTVSQLQEMAEVSRGTAGNALQELREQPAQLHIISENTITRTQP